MTDKHELIALAERVEALTGPDANIGEQALLAGGWRKTQRGYWMGPLYWWTPPDGSRGFDGDDFYKHNPLASLDAAMTLVPEGWWWTTGNCSVSADASMGPDVAHCSKEMLIAFNEGLHHDLPHPSTPAISLTALALRARAAIIEWERQQ